MTHHTWEYHVESISGRSAGRLIQDLNELGANGWELVAVHNDQAIFKRIGPNYHERATLAQKAQLVAGWRKSGNEA